MAERIRVEDSYEEIERLLRERGMTDGLPIVPPTPERVDAMIAASGRSADESLGDFPPLCAPATVEKIAINATLAGCAPGSMPVLLAAVEAFLEPQMNAHGIQTTTNPVSPMILINGPIRKRLEINCDSGCFGPGARANATIGRALRLIQLNLGGAAPGEVDKAPLGWPGKYNSCCIGENEEESPWESFAVERGFAPGEDAVSIIPVNGIWPITDLSPDSEAVLHHVTHGMALSGPCGGQRAPDGFEAVLVMSPVIAQMVARHMPSKRAFKQHLFEHARVPLDFYPPYRREATLRTLAANGVRIQGDRIPVCDSPDDFVVLVAGGMGGLQSVGLSCMLGRTTTRRVV